MAKDGKIIPRSYGSIPHLSNSKLSQQADKKIMVGQEKILTEKTRDSKDVVIVTEKIDGSNVGVYKKDGKLYALNRSGYEAKTSPHKQHHLFDQWVIDNSDKFMDLPEGWRICGEWCIQVHGTMYDISNESPFVAFDLINEKNERESFTKLAKFTYDNNVERASVVSIGDAIAVEYALKLTEGHLLYGMTDKLEGLVYRVEREGKVDFLAKWVRADKEDGKYMKDDIFNTGWKESLRRK